MLRTYAEFTNIIKIYPYEADSLLEGESMHIAFLANELSKKKKISCLYIKI